MDIINIRRCLSLCAFILSWLFMFYYLYYDYIYSDDVIRFLGYGPGGTLVEIPGWFSWGVYVAFSICYMSIFFNFLKIRWFFLIVVLINMLLTFVSHSAAYTSLDVFMGNLIYMCDGVLLFTLFYKADEASGIRR